MGWLSIKFNSVCLVRVWPIAHVKSVKVEDLYFFMVSLAVAFLHGCWT